MSCCGAPATEDADAEDDGGNRKRERQGPLLAHADVAIGPAAAADAEEQESVGDHADEERGEQSPTQADERVRCAGGTHDEQQADAEHDRGA